MKNLFTSISANKNLARFLFNEAMGNSLDGIETFSAEEKELNELVDAEEIGGEKSVAPETITPDEINDAVKQSISRLPENIKYILGTTNIDIPAEITDPIKMLEFYENSVNRMPDIVKGGEYIKLSYNESSHEGQSLNIDAIKEKKPFPDGNDRTQDLLSNFNPNEDAKGSITNEEGLRYYDEDGALHFDETVTLTSTLKDDLAPLEKFKIKPQRLYELVIASSESNNFTIYDAETIVAAINGVPTKVYDVQTAFSNISENFKLIVNGVDNKYGENTRAGVRTAALNLGDILDKSQRNPIDVSIVAPELSHAIYEVNTLNNLGGSTTYEPIKSKDRKDYIEEKYQGDVDSITGYKNTILMTDWLADGPVSYLFKDGEMTPVETPKKALQYAARIESNKENKENSAVRKAERESFEKEKRQQRAEQLAKNEAERAQRLAAIAAQKEAQQGD